MQINKNNIYISSLKRPFTLFLKSLEHSTGKIKLIVVDMTYSSNPNKAYFNKFKEVVLGNVATYCWCLVIMYLLIYSLSLTLGFNYNLITYFYDWEENASLLHFPAACLRLFGEIWSWKRIWILTTKQWRTRWRHKGNRYGPPWIPIHHRDDMLPSNKQDDYRIIYIDGMLH